METAILDISQTGRRGTDQTSSYGYWQDPRPGTPLLSGSVDLGIDVDMLSLEGGVLLRRPSGPTVRSWWSSWWKLGDLTSPTIPAVRPGAVSKSTTALEAVHLLKELFEITTETVATASGVGRTTIHHWQREGSSPRPSSVNGLWRLYGIGMGLRTVLGVAGARSWIRSGQIAPLELLAAGDLSGFERRASTVLFSDRASREFDPGIAIPDEIVLGAGEPMPSARGIRHRHRSRRA